METLQLANGKTFDFDWDYTPEGARFYIQGVYTVSEKQEIKSILNTERDAVSITYIK